MPTIDELLNQISNRASMLHPGQPRPQPTIPALDPATENSLLGSFAGRTLARSDPVFEFSQFLTDATVRHSDAQSAFGPDREWSQ